ncbi:MAG: restriction endonuclease [Candidatus Acidiferrales bacterium]
MTTLDAALQKFEATEANLEKLDKLWSQIQGHLQGGPAFGSPPEYDELCLAFRRVLPGLPAIDGFRVEDRLLEFDSVGQMRVDALEVDEISAHVSVEDTVEEQGRILREYRFKLNAKRRELVQDRMLNLIDEVDNVLRGFDSRLAGKKLSDSVPEETCSQLKKLVAEIDILLGSSVRPQRWSDMRRHLSFSMVGDLSDIRKLDWPTIKYTLQSNLYGEQDPIPVGVEDLGEVVAGRPTGEVTAQLRWSVLSDEGFERLVFLILSTSPGYENPEWLQQTHAPDRGRDLSVMRVEDDPLAGVRRHRIIVQCKHWLSKSVSVPDVITARGQMELWQPPRVDYLIIATSGRFTVDAIKLIEDHNQSDRALHISMWPETHLERLLAARPYLISEFRLRKSE